MTTVSITKPLAPGQAWWGITTALPWAVSRSLDETTISLTLGSETFDLHVTGLKAKQWHWDTDKVRVGAYSDGRTLWIDTFSLVEGKPDPAGSAAMHLCFHLDCQFVAPLVFYKKGLDCRSANRQDLPQSVDITTVHGGTVVKIHLNMHDRPSEPDTRPARHVVL